MTDKITIERETLQAALDAINPHYKWHPAVERLSEHLRAALAAQPAEPVARVVLYGAMAKLIWADTASARNCTPGALLYAAPPATAAVALTDNKILSIAHETDTLMVYKIGTDSAKRFARAVLAAAGDKP